MNGMDDALQNIYSIHGQLFFASVQEGSRLIIDFTEARIWDDSGAGAIDRLIEKLKQKNVDYQFFSLDVSSSRLLEGLSVPYERGRRGNL